MGEDEEIYSSKLVAYSAQIQAPCQHYGKLNKVLKAVANLILTISEAMKQATYVQSCGFLKFVFIKRKKRNADIRFEVASASMRTLVAARACAFTAINVDEHGCLSSFAKISTSTYISRGGQNS